VKKDLLAPLPAGKLPAWLLGKVLPVSSTDPQVIVGPGLGADAAAIAVGDRIVVAKSDPITFASQRSELHLVEINANDIACLGATPRWLLVTGLLPQGVTAADVLRNFADLREACRHRSVELVGGHTEIVPGLNRPILVGMMLGDADPQDLIKPGGAQAGDVLLLTKGLAIEGTALLARDRAGQLEPLIGEFMLRNSADLIESPGISIVRDAELARSAGGITAMHDPTEGGLATAIRELATISGTGARVDADAIPVLPETRAVTEALGLDPLGLLASGSLLIAARPDAVSSVVHAVAHGGIDIHVVGVLTEEPGEFVLDCDGSARPLPEFAVDELARFFASNEDRNESASW
jgi:hydrogenase expression/formation protein HypE